MHQTRAAIRDTNDALVETACQKPTTTLIMVLETVVYDLRKVAGRTGVAAD